MNTNSWSQEMDNEKLQSIFYTISDQIEGFEGNWTFVIDSTVFVCITDQKHNRMRIVAPIIQTTELSNEQMKKCMEANFHTALDIRYAITDGLVWSAFIHPLRELSKDQVISAVSQVYSGVKTFGKEYSSGLLEFPKQSDENLKRN